MSETPVVPPNNIIIQEEPGFFEKIKQLFNYASCGMLYSPPAQVVTLCPNEPIFAPAWIHQSEPLTEEELERMAVILKK